jgi:hypothetical protein
LDLKQGTLPRACTPVIVESLLSACELEQCSDIAPLDLLGDPGYQLAENGREVQQGGGEDWHLHLQ